MAWRLARLISVGSMLALAALLAARPQVGLIVLWSLVVPLVPVVFLVAPTLWRNVCPMATVNQAPRGRGRSLARPMPGWLRANGYAGAAILFVGLVALRPLVLERSGAASALLLLALMGATLTGGVLLRGKAGWCASLCPLRPIQGLYGRAPLVAPVSSACAPCLGCTKHCADLKPRGAHGAELRDRVPGRARQRVLFAAALPGLIVGFSLGDSGSLAVGVLSSLGAFLLVESVGRVGTERLVVVCAGLAFALFTWLNVPVVLGGLEALLGLTVPGALLWTIRAAFVLLAAGWLARALPEAPTGPRPARDRRPLRRTGHPGHATAGRHRDALFQTTSSR